MLTQKRMYMAVCVMAMLVMTACAALGVPKPETWNQRVVAAYSSVTAARETATILVNRDKLSAADAQNVQNTLNEARKGIEVAEALYKLKPADGEDKLVSTLRILQAAQAYLAGVQK